MEKLWARLLLGPHWVQQWVLLWWGWHLEPTGWWWGLLWWGRQSLELHLVQPWWGLHLAQLLWE